MKKELESLLTANNATLKLNDIFYLRRDLGRDEITGRDIDNLFLSCHLPGFPAVWSERITAREYDALIAEIDAAMRGMMEQTTDRLSTRLRAGKL